MHLNKIYTLDNQRFNFQLIYEKRRSIRFATGKRKIIIRAPSSLSNLPSDHYFDKARRWLYKLTHQNPSFSHYLALKNYAEGDTINSYSKGKIPIYTQRAEKKSILYTGTSFQIHGYDHLDLIARNDLLPKAISKQFVLHNGPAFKDQVTLINSQWLDKPIQNIRIKYNTSNWGSCSTRKNLNFSSRLLLLPPHIQEYVIVHELAHLEVANHSHRFWSLVARACPHYKDAERWIKKYGFNYDF